MPMTDIDISGKTCLSIGVKEFKFIVLLVVERIQFMLVYSGII